MSYGKVGPYRGHFVLPSSLTRVTYDLLLTVGCFIDSFPLLQTISCPLKKISVTNVKNIALEISK